MKNKVILTALASTSAGAIALSTSTVTAQTASETYSPLVQKLAERFGLQESDVQAVFDEERLQQHQRMEQRMQEKLEQAVEDGQITLAQKEAIIAKHQEMVSEHQAHMDEWRTKSPAERKLLRDAHKQEIEQWAEENGLTFDNLFFNRRMMNMRHQ
jgi:hypothetical protein